MAKDHSEAGESPEEEAAEPVKEQVEEIKSGREGPSLEEISALSDEELHHLLGHKKSLDNVREGLAEAEKLTGAARTHAENRVKDMFTPHISDYDFKYLAEDARRHVANKKKDAKAALNDTSPMSVL